MNNIYLLESLDYRIDSISELKELYEKALNKDKSNIRKEYYLEVAYFVHSIYENYELSILFNELLLYRSNLKLKKEYSEAINNIRQSIKSIANSILTDDLFDEFVKKEISDWVNPFNVGPITLDIKTLLEKLKNLDDYQLRITYNEIYSLFISEDELNGILNRFSTVSSNVYEDFIYDLDSIRNNLHVLFFYDQFEHDFYGVNSAIHIQQIYKVLHPLITAKNFNEAIFRGIIQSGEETLEADRLISHCRKIREYFRQKLVSKFSIDASINKFKHYMEVFYKGDINKQLETDFQKEFELFMFNIGYFALSQGQLGNGRFDNIVINEHNAFLCEHKQIGFEKSVKTKKSQIEKFKKGVIQTKIYHERLKLFPELSNDVYIIIFSKYYIGFKGNKKEIQKDGLTFNFRLINLEKIAPTKIKNIEVIDLDELLK